MIQNVDFQILMDFISHRFEDFVFTTNKDGLVLLKIPDFRMDENHARALRGSVSLVIIQPSISKPFLRVLFNSELSEQLREIYKL